MDGLTQEDFDTIATVNIFDDEKILKNVIDSYDEFIDTLPSIITEQFSQSAIHKYDNPKNGVVQVGYGMDFSNVIFHTPSEIRKGPTTPIYPINTKNSNKTYEFTIYATITAWTQLYMDNGIGKAPTQRERVYTEIKDKLIGDMPIMVKSKLCHLYNMDPLAQIALGEDPSDKGGYFIIKGSCKVLIPRKNNIKNQAILTKSNTGLITCKFSSQKGDYYDQSKYIVIELLPNGALMCSIPISKEQKFIVPFYIIYYMLDKTVDKEIFNTILPDFDPKDPKHIAMATHFQSAMSMDYTTLKESLSEEHYFNRYNEVDIQKKIELSIVIAQILNLTSKSKVAELNKYRMSNDTEKKDTFQKIVQYFDNLLFPHIGVTQETRIDKLNHLGSCIRKVFEVKEGGDTTDRNSLKNVRIYESAPGLISAFKSVFNYVMVTKIFNEMRKKVQETPNFDVNQAINSKIDRTSLGDTMGKILKAGNKPEITIKKDNKITNRVTTNQKDFTNKGAEISVAHSITSDPNSMGGKTNDKVVKARSVHASEQGVKCIMQSIEGSNAGVVGQMAIASQITSGIASQNLIEMLTPQMSSFDKMNEKGSTYSQVFVNGNPLGTHHDVRILAKEYRQMRRDGLIHPRISIEFKPLQNGELHFHTDMGRMLQPLVIVYQNKNETDLINNEWPSKPTKGKGDPDNWQYVLFTPKHAMLIREKKMTLDDLVEEGIIEWIAPDEYMDIMVCDSWDTFVNTRDSRLHEYTHLGIPIAQLCVAILTTTFGNHSQPVRTVYNGKFVKQTIGFPGSQYGRGFWSKLPVRHHVYNTPVRTVSDRVYNHGATPVVVLVMADTENQEDSIIMSDILSQNDKFTADIYNSISIELEIDHTLAVPDLRNTTNVSGTDFSHLHSTGLPISGSVIYPGMAVVGIVQQVSSTGEKIDRSAYHKKSYPIVINHASLEFDNGQSQIVKVSYKTTSRVEEGDKFGAKSGCKGVGSVIRRHCEMPISKEGIIAEMIYNPSSVPTRMVAGQIMEGTLGAICARMMAYADATMYKEYNEKDLDRIAAELGISDNGIHVMYDGTSGRRIKGRLCIWNNGYQRINKLAADNSAVTNVSSINRTTQQPEKSVARGGGQRLGYMEFDALNAHGCSETIRNIAFVDSDAKTYYICDKCQTFAGVNPKKNIYQCNHCDETTFSRIQTNHATNLITGQMTMLGASVKIKQKKALAI